MNYTLFIPLGLVVAASSVAAFYVYSPSDVAAHEIDACLGKGAQKEYCLNGLIEAAGSESIEAGFDILAAVYTRDQEFADSCHGTTHTLGELAYEDFKNATNFALSPKTAYCGFGFFHGFMEALLAEGGDIAEARRFCDWADGDLQDATAGVSVACYHGIGHGIIDGSDPEAWGNVHAFIAPGLALCDTLGDNLEHKTRCASGVFNSLGVAYFEPKYKLPIDSRDPYAVCRTQQLEYQKRACYDQMNSYVFPKTKAFKEALALAATTPESAYRELAVSTVAGFAAKETLARALDAAEVVQACADIAPALREPCARGFANGLIEFGLPGDEFRIPLAACKESGVLAKACFEGVAHAAHDRVDRATQEKVCAAMHVEAGETFGRACDNIINNRATDV